MWAAVALAAAACGQGAPQPPTIAGAKPVSYDAIRTASGVLEFAEPALGRDLARGTAQGRGASLVERSRVIGAWELPADTGPETVSQQLQAGGSVSDANSYRQGQLWVADYQPDAGGPAMRLLMIDGRHWRFQQQQPPELRPGPHRYLIAYRDE